MKRLLFIFIIVTFVNNAQSQSASSTALGRANILQPISITSISGALDFGEIILTGTSTNYQINPALGQQFLITGNPGRSVSITFNQITLSNANWVAFNGGSMGILTFMPSVVNSNNNVIISGNFYPLINSGTVAMMYIRAGGSITVSSNQPPGNYSGIFTISVSY